MNQDSAMATRVGGMHAFSDSPEGKRTEACGKPSTSGNDGCNHGPGPVWTHAGLSGPLLGPITFEPPALSRRQYQRARTAWMKTGPYDVALGGKSRTFRPPPGMGFGSQAVAIVGPQRHREASATRRSRRALRTRQGRQQPALPALRGANFRIGTAPGHRGQAGPAQCPFSPDDGQGFANELPALRGPDPNGVHVFFD